MLINSEKLIGLKTETQSGAYVGKIRSFDIDIETQGVRTYLIKKPPFVPGFSEGLIVHHKQVVSISEEKMVVLDNVVKYKEESRVFAGTGAEVS